MSITKEDKRRWRRIEIKVLKHSAQRVADAGATEAFKDYLIERFYMDHKKEELPDSPIEICRMLCSRLCVGRFGYVSCTCATSRRNRTNP